MKNPHFKRQAGFSLVEVTIALGVAGFCLLAIFGLLPVGVNSNRISVEQSDAANIAVAVAADLRATPLSTATPPGDTMSPRFQFTIPTPGSPSGPPSATGLPQVLYFSQDGTALGTVPSPAKGTKIYRVSVGFKYDPITVNPAMTNSKINKGAVSARIMVTWPAVADTKTTWPTSFAGVFETALALNRN